MISVGFDIGTKFIKACIVEKNNLCGVAIKRIKSSIDQVFKAVYKKALESAGITRKKIKGIAATGYCADLVKKALYTVSEPLCMARAVHHLNINVRTIVDVGNLFINIVTIDRNGLVVESITNDKCASGSGKFIEMVSEAIDIPFGSISDHVRQSEKTYQITSNCAVFAESEIISMVNDNRNKDDIIASVFHSIVTRVVAMLTRINAINDITLIGGVSKIEAFRMVFEKKTSYRNLVLPMDIQLITAYGAALIAQGHWKRPPGKLYRIPIVNKRRL